MDVIAIGCLCWFIAMGATAEWLGRDNHPRLKFVAMVGFSITAVVAFSSLIYPMQSRIDKLEAELAAIKTEKK